jgi:hypothetical protein
MIFTSIANAKKLTGLTYFGKVNNSTKHEKAYKYNELVYTIYLAPAKSSGYEVCPGRTKECTAACLSQSGRNIMDKGREIINTSRIKKTKLFFEEREFTVNWIIKEIELAKNKAKKNGYRFSVRLNNTSDISPEDFYIIKNNLKINLLQYFPDVQFYDYTKIVERVQLTMKYHNYDLTFSYNGYNMATCKEMLNQNIRVAMVFLKVPNVYMDRPVIDGDKYDMRYLDDKNSIVGLKYKRVRTKLNYNNNFVIR